MFPLETRGTLATGLYHFYKGKDHLVSQEFIKILLKVPILDLGLKDYSLNVFLGWT